MAGRTIGIVGNAPSEALPDLSMYSSVVDSWIGADRGAIHLLKADLRPEVAVGDFDSVSESEQMEIEEKSTKFIKMPSKKDETDLEVAIRIAVSQNAQQILLFGVTTGRKDHELVNIQLLYRIIQSGIKGKIIDEQNELELTLPGTYPIAKDETYPYVSFIPFSEQVEGLTLKGFYYPLEDETVSWGSTLCISNELELDIGHLSYRRGILLIIKSRDV
jgi:thiamine pyrophosphokinase